MRARVLLTACLVLLLLVTLTFDVADAKKKKKQQPATTPNADTDAPPPAPPKSARDDDPVVKRVRKLRNAAMGLMDKREFAPAIEKMRAAISDMHARVFGDARASVTDPKDQAADAAYYAQLLSDYGSVLVRDRQFAEAVDVLEDSTKLTKKLFGESHPSYGLATRSLADAYMAQNEFRKAVDTYKTLRRHVKLGLGVAHEAYMEVNLRIAEGYKKLGDLARAVKVCQKAIRDQDGQVNLDTKGVAELYMELAMALNLAGGDVAEAATHAEAAREMFRAREGEDSIEFAFSLNALAGVRMREQKVAEAHALLRQAHDIALRLYGKDHKMVHASEKTLRDVKARMDELAAAADDDADEVEKDEL
ncbi:hypothetical protein PybrP1_013180 [[Pythium] brassicae (nom. inval.)]|nr:hypothetical protein PybrP1_013180 [[Pythium] brassicae (nom. inval.)]